jgi:hypothetical protein
VHDAVFPAGLSYNRLITERDYSMKYCWAQYLLWLVIAILGAGSMLSACGQKGDLVRPDVNIESSEY